MNNWSTPHAHNSHGQPGAGHRERGGRHRDLVSEAMAHPKPACGGGGNLVSTPKHTGGIDLEGAVELWQPPATDSFRSRGGDRKDEMGLDQQARLTQFPTPAARDYKSESGGGSDSGTLQPPSRADIASHDRALFPPGPSDRDAWTRILRERPELAPAVAKEEDAESEVRSVDDGTSRGMDFSRQDQLRGLGNMVVPQQGALALLILIDQALAPQPGGGKE